MSPILDHVTIGAATLEAGAGWLASLLGGEIPPGGKHREMGTHNRVLNVGEQRFLELIAIDPEASPVSGRRWFGLDDPRVSGRISIRPRGVGWVVRVDDLDRFVAESPIDHGRIVRMARGGRSWRLTVRDDGLTLHDGLAPSFIEWDPGPHPAQGMQFLGPRLAGIALRHPDPVAVQQTLLSLGVASLATVSHADEPSIAFVIAHPDGRLLTLGD